MVIDPDLSSVGAACLSPKGHPRAAFESRRDAMCGRHTAPTELKGMVFGVSVLHTCRSYGTFKELFDLLIILVVTYKIKSSCSFGY